uniref:Uncharacterized protein n=1 Tax=Opuntia streptacantha TaxID=393608 RepID=A0A7C9EAS5_OPUST
MKNKPPLTLQVHSYRPEPLMAAKTLVSVYPSEELSFPTISYLISTLANLGYFPFQKLRCRARRQTGVPKSKSNSQSQTVILLGPMSLQGMNFKKGMAGRKSNHISQLKCSPEPQSLQLQPVG